MTASSSDNLTTFAETSALLAVMDDDLPKARSIIADLFPHERKMFAEQLARLLSMLGGPCQECGGLTPAALSVATPAFGPTRRCLCHTCAGFEKESGPGEPLGQSR
ncbi:hypothetical protein [Streptomyces sp. CAU 1734]|uniref:hypothetical protein n=1 Tax=Streptomyces sp. CAU 1734 TaxID=3140360 RepID=UPI0032600D92